LRRHLKPDLVIIDDIGLKALPKHRIKDSLSPSLPEESSARSKKPSTAGAASWDSQPSPAHLSGCQTP
jgi:hypothetical protein